MGLVSAAPFAVEAAAFDGSYNSNGGVIGSVSQTAGPGLVSISYSANDNSYTVSLPTYETGRLVNSRGSGSYDANGWINLSGSYSDVSVGSTSEVQAVVVMLDWPASSQFTYTNFGTWGGSNGLGGGSNRYRNGVFAYGVPTAAGNVPVTGSGSYSGTVRAMSSAGWGWDIWGNVGMVFDFGAGTLSGQLSGLNQSDGWDYWPLADMTFRNTVFGVGSTTFSGQFTSAGANLDSAFSGRFTGPGASELMASFYSSFTNIAQAPDRMVGVWIAKKQ